VITPSDFISVNDCVQFHYLSILSYLLIRFFLQRMIGDDRPDHPYKGHTSLERTFYTMLQSIGWCRDPQSQLRRLKLIFHEDEFDDSFMDALGTISCTFPDAMDHDEKEWNDWLLSRHSDSNQDPTIESRVHSDDMLNEIKMTRRYRNHLDCDSTFSPSFVIDSTTFVSASVTQPQNENNAMINHNHKSDDNKSRAKSKEFIIDNQESKRLLEFDVQSRLRGYPLVECFTFHSIREYTHLLQINLECFPVVICHFISTYLSRVVSPIITVFPKVVQQFTQYKEKARNAEKEYNPELREDHFSSETTITLAIRNDHMVQSPYLIALTNVDICGTNYQSIHQQPLSGPSLHTTSSLPLRRNRSATRMDPSTSQMIIHSKKMHFPDIHQPYTYQINSVEIQKSYSDFDFTNIGSICFSNVNPFIVYILHDSNSILKLHFKRRPIKMESKEVAALVSTSAAEEIMRFNDNSFFKTVLALDPNNNNILYVADKQGQIDKIIMDETPFNESREPSQEQKLFQPVRSTLVSKLGYGYEILQMIVSADSSCIYLLQGRDVVLSNSEEPTFIQSLLRFDMNSRRLEQLSPPEINVESFCLDRDTLYWVDSNHSHIWSLSLLR
jgi:hypothetical protein